jgi:hypothetical protein
VTRISGGLAQQVEAALAKLADGCDTAAQVAAKLTAEGISGERGNCYACPVVHWLALELGPRADVTVGVDQAVVGWMDECGVRVGKVTADLPAALTMFIVSFDQDAAAFPDLDPAPAGTR